jgi:hypothetical protein
MNPRLINNQNQLDDLVGSYGRNGSIAANGCGAIAITNVCILDGMQDIALEDVIDYNTSLPNGLVLGGLFGTNPFAIKKILTNFGFDVTFLGKFKSVEQVKPYNYFIILYAWHNGFQLGAHYQAGRVLKNGKFELYNYYRTYADVEQFKEFEKPIFPIVFGIN